MGQGLLECLEEIYLEETGDRSARMPSRRPHMSRSTADELSADHAEIFLRRRGTARRRRDGGRISGRCRAVRHESHGLIRVSEYLRQIRDGVVVPGAQPEIVEDRAPRSSSTGTGAFGQVVARRATEWLIERALEHGFAAAAIRRCGHVGRAGAYPTLAAERGLVGLALRERRRQRAAGGAVRRAQGRVRDQSDRGGGTAARLATGGGRLLHRRGRLGQDQGPAGPGRCSPRRLDSEPGGTTKHAAGGLLRRRDARSSCGTQGLRAVPPGRAARRMPDGRRLPWDRGLGLQGGKRRVSACLRPRSIRVRRPLLPARPRSRAGDPLHSAGRGLRRGAATPAIPSGSLPAHGLATEIELATSTWAAIVPAAEELGVEI